MPRPYVSQPCIAPSTSGGLWLGSWQDSGSSATGAVWKFVAAAVLDAVEEDSGEGPSGPDDVGSCVDVYFKTVLGERGS